MKFQAFQIPLNQIFPDPKQPRKKFSEANLVELAASIKQHGIIQPIIVTQLTTDQYQIIAGERRWRAAKIAELTVIPAIIRADKLQENMAIALIENIQREELNPIELAKAFYRLNHEYQLSHEAIAEMIGKGRVTVTNVLRLLNLTEEVQMLLLENKLEMGHARTLLTLSPEQQIQYAQLIIQKDMTVREAEKLVQKYKQPEKEKITPYSTEVNLWIKKLSDAFPSKVAIDINDKGQGKMIIHFASVSEADCLVQHFVSHKVSELE
jgi:ParB family chromosome partitioning protein